jgi:hypothetical protein
MLKGLIASAPIDEQKINQPIDQPIDQKTISHLFVVNARFSSYCTLSP